MMILWKLALDIYLEAFLAFFFPVAQIIENFLNNKLGEIDEALSQSIKPLAQLSPNEFTNLLLTLSRQELIARFGQDRTTRAILP